MVQPQIPLVLDEEKPPSEGETSSGTGRSDSVGAFDSVEAPSLDADGLYPLPPAATFSRDLYEAVRNVVLGCDQVSVELALTETHLPIIGGLVQRLRAALHELVFFYVSRLAARQVRFNEQTAGALSVLVRDLDAEVRDLRARLAELEPQAEALARRLGEKGPQEEHPSRDSIAGPIRAERPGGSRGRPAGLLGIIQDGVKIEETLFRTLRVRGVSFDVVIGVGDGDLISESIAEKTFSFPASFRLPFALMQPGLIVLDLGAHVGTFSLAAAALGCKVVAVEASPYNAALLNASVARNGFDQMRVVSAAVSDCSGSLEFVQAGPFGLVANPLVKPSTIQVPAVTVDELLVKVPAVTVDELLVEIGCDRVDLIKMDVEGSEVSALRGMSRLLARASAPWILYESNGHTLHLFGETPNSLIAALEEIGYDNYSVEPGQLVPVCAEDLQAECVVDYIACKQLPDGLQGWQVRPPRTFEETVSEVLSACAYPHEHHRTYTAHALAGADPAVLSDGRVRNALRSLSRDPHADVRAAMSWWTEADSAGRTLFGGRVAESLAKAMRHLRSIGAGEHRSG